ncbi:SusC/RagA family TonB-linked outer membrane protein [Pedobacter sp. HMF7056]|uniref:SusC/RagA family TonB-linked outer membrane protein n=2 Tax=Hufsiella ginkgonis TaxID=2695274 RepID=A0A7K1XZU6_9SPHI|nr:SusC/RagA family TonB-linked outer membrane protein [Hufsiella ginkgonis]
MAQNLKVSGTVRDSTGVLPGVSVKVKGAATGGSTSVNGTYTITAPRTAVLTFTFVGMKTQEFPLNNVRANSAGEYTLNVTMSPDQNALEEVAVVGFGTQKKTTMVGSVTTISPKELKGPTSNLTQMLAGRLSGVIGFQSSGEPGSDNASFFVRGIGSFGTGQVSPLILIDGIESTQTDLARLQADDIASFSLLKDATAAAVYGARGANGIVLIKTKEGEAGKTKFTFRFENTLSENTQNFKFADNITYMNLANEAALTRNPLNPIPYSQTKINRTASGTANPYLYPSNNWIDQIIKDKTLNQRYNMSVTGGADKAKYYVGGTFNVDNGIYKVDQLNNFNNNVKLLNYSIRSNVTLQLTKSTRADIRVYGQFDDYNGPLGGGKEIFQAAIFANPVMFPMRYPASYAPNIKHPLFGNAVKETVPGSSVGGGLYNNPYAFLVQGYRQQNKSNLQPQIELTQDLDGLTKGLKFRFMGYVRRNSEFDINRSYFPFYYSAGSTDGTDIVLNALNPGGAGSIGTTGSEYLNYAEGDKELSSALYTETAMNYGRTFAGKHAISGMLIATLRNSLNGNAGSLQASLPKRNQGISGRFTYGYDERYMTEFNFGYNGTERFAKNHRFGFFPSIGVAYVVSNENFWEPMSNVVSKMKLRATYGLNGNDAIGADTDRFFYLSNVNLTGGPSYSFGEDPSLLYSRPGIQVLRYANDRITWEESKQLNLGVDFSLYNALNVTIDAYKKRTSNILQDRSAVPSTMGLLAAAVANVGVQDNKGIDMQADYSKSLGNKSWVQIRGTFTYATNKIVTYDEPSYPASLAHLYRVGHSAGESMGYIAERLFTDDIEVDNSPSQAAIAGGVRVRGGDIKYRDVNNDGVINTNDRVFMGLPSTPEITYGFGFSASHKSFDLSAQVNGNARFAFFVNSGAFNGSSLSESGIAPFVQIGGYQNGLLQAIAEDHWSEDNRNAYAFWPRLNSINTPNNAVRSSWWMREGSFLRLQQVEVGFTPKQQWRDKLHMKNIRLYVSARNLFVVTKFKLWDPEVRGNGLDYPLQRVYNFGVNVGL